MQLVSLVCSLPAVMLTGRDRREHARPGQPLGPGRGAFTATTSCGFTELISVASSLLSAFQNLKEIISTTLAPRSSRLAVHCDRFLS